MMLRQRGFTLLELMISLLLLSVVLETCYSFLYIGQQQYKLQRNRIDEQQNVRIVLNKIENELRKASILKDKVITKQITTLSGEHVNELYIDDVKIYFSEQQKAIQYTHNGGTNQLAYNITEFTATVSDQMLHIHIKAQTDSSDEGISATTGFYLRE